MKTVNDLVKVLSHHTQLVREVADAERALLHNGTPSWVEGKVAELKQAREALEAFGGLDLPVAAEEAFL
jgi:light-regulated signal transduction histidine kinase (bacteriophytochrome)